MMRILIAIAVLLGSAVPVVASSHARESLALGYQTEHADLVAMARLVSVAEDEAGDLRVVFSVTENIRGDATTGTSLVVAYPDTDHTPPWRAGRNHLLFLARRGSGDVYRALTGPTSIRAIPEEGAIARLPGMVRRIAATLADGDRPADREALQGLLVEWMQDPEPGVAWSAATDFVRRGDLHHGLNGARRAKVLAAFLAHPFGKASKDALAMAVAAARPKGAGEALVSVLDGKAGRTIRGTIGEALAVLKDPAVPGLIAKRLETAEAAARAGLVQVLGAVGGGESVAVARKFVADASAEVRVEAAHALGRIARSVRTAKPDAKVAGTTDLEGMLAAAEDPRERQAALWALAQLQDPEAVALLTKLARDDERKDVRRWAARYRERPRLTLILR
ncbi:MAG: HEAT repeat domain-containing protein [Planctomycetota bacterium]